MKSHLGSHFRGVRIDQSIKLDQLARQLGYKNVNKGCRRLRTFERTGDVPAGLLSQLAQQLRVNTDTIAELNDRDRQEKERWMSQPIQPYIVIRLISAMYCRKTLPDQIADYKQAIDWVSEYARQFRLEVCLVWSRKQVVYFNSGGHPKADSKSRIPAMVISGRPALFEISKIEPGLTLASLCSQS